MQQYYYDIAFKRMQSAEKSFQRKECFGIVNDDVQKLLGQDFLIKVPTINLNGMQAVFTIERTTKVHLVFDVSSKGHNGLSLNNHLRKGPNYFFLI